MPDILCKIIGHNWHYKDYTHAMQPDGTPYPYTESRKCFRCNLRFVRIHEDKWITPPVTGRSIKKTVESAVK